MYVEILVEIKSKHVDKVFTYKVTDDLEQKVEIGKRVLVPFGKQIVEGYILNILSDTTIDAKEIIDIIDDEPVLNEEMLKMGYFLKEKTLCSLSLCYSSMLPKALKAKNGVVVNKKLEKYLILKIPLEDALERVKSNTQKDILLLFTTLKVLKKEANHISISATKTLIKNGILEEVNEEVYRYQRENVAHATAKVFNDEQMSAYLKIKGGLNRRETFLLHGVTGSGKTEIYLKLIGDVINNGKTALVLVPEISLTPQLIKRFEAYFDISMIAILHSGLSDGERYDEWRKITSGTVKIVIGARSAVFAPLTNLGIIILDEEHSESYKQENNPRYHALDIAIKRSETWNCPVILGSATPTLNSMARAQKKIYTYVPLMKRANGSILPKCEIVDMTGEVTCGHSILSRELECKIIEKLDKNEQVMLLLNRRGFSTTITCSNCGFTYRCPNCDITLTYHKSTNTLRCHYCGYTKYKENACPKCHEDALNYYGLGTEKLTEYLENIFPTARIIRMDRDSTANKGMYEKITSDFYNHKYDILVGTQMISKGLDFPFVSLVGIINADASLNIPDFRSNEKTFSLLYQASGRAGRANTTGEVIIQTFYPNNYILNCVKMNDYFKFYKYEMNIRKTLKYPPFYYLVSLTIKSKQYDVASKEARNTKEYLEQNIDSSSIILGPSTANQFFINKVYHFEILIKYRFDDKLMNALSSLDQIYLIHNKASLDIEFI